MRSKSLLIFLILLSSLLFAGYAVSLWSLYSVKASVDALEIQTKDTHQNLDKELSLKSMANAIRSNTAKLANFIVPHTGDISFIESVESLGKTSGVTLSITSVTEVLGTDFDSLIFQVTAKGSWSSTLRFITLLETMPYDIRLRTVSLDSSDEGIAKPGSKLWKTAIEFSVSKSK